MCGKKWVRPIKRASLPQNDATAEGTSIGASVQIAINILQQSGPPDLQQLGGGEIIVLSDGFESHAPRKTI